MKNFFLNNFSMKIIALGLAIIVWVYVNGQIIRQ